MDSSTSTDIAMQTTPVTPADGRSIDTYFRKYGNLLAQMARERLRPIHDPENDPTLECLRELGEPLLEAQAHVVTAISKSLGDRGGFLLVGEPGCGKTHMGIGVVHALSKRLRRCHRSLGRPYRACVMCPDHLLDKWIRTIKKSLPKAMVRRFANWRDFVYFVEAHRDNPTSAPISDEWYVIGRDQSKFEATWEATAVAQGTTVDVGTRDGKKVRSRRKYAACPRCGALMFNSQKVPLKVEDLKQSKKKCKADVEYLDHVEQKYKKRECGETLYTYKSKPMGTSPLARWKDPFLQMKADIRRQKAKAQKSDFHRWPPAKILGRLPWKFDFLIADEIHELLSDTSAQASAFGKLCAKSRKVLGMTGTLINGYPNVMPLLVRIDGARLARRGFEWGEIKEFRERYGRQEYIEIIKYEEDQGKSNTHSMGGKKTHTIKQKPGIMPGLFGECLLGNTAFLALNQMADHLPAFEEEVIAVAMDPELQEEYDLLETALKEVVQEMLARGDKSALGMFLHTLLGYPDKPYGWGTIGYYKHWVDPKTKEKMRTWTPVYKTKDLSEETIRCKEQALIELIKAEVKGGNQVWVYFQMTDTLDIMKRMADVVRLEADVTVEVLRSSVGRDVREKWIAEKGKTADVIFSHPKLVETGFDLFSRSGSHNFSTLIFYETGYNLYTLRQAACRAWRLMQPKSCKVYHLFYQGTMQHRCVLLMADKSSAAEMLEGSYNPEGLAAMSNMEDPTTALAKTLAASLDLGGPTWQKVEATSMAEQGEFLGGNAFFDEESERLARKFLERQKARGTKRPGGA